MAKISSVQDPITGSNYGGISQTSSGVNASYQEYLNNLMETVSRPVAGPMKQEQYTPSGGRSPIIGQISTPSLGSTPIFGSGSAIFPMAVLDRFKQAKHDAEISYLNEIGDVSLDTFKLGATLKNPWHNQAFSSKYQEALDVWLDASASKFGGDYMKGMKALKMNKDFYRMAKSYEDYASIYNATFDKAVDILSTDPKDGYVSEDVYNGAKKFIHDYENIEDMPIDKLVQNARTWQKHTSVYEIAKNAVDGLGTRVYEEYIESSSLGTDEKKAVLKKTEKGMSEAEFKALVDAQVQANPFIKDDPIAYNLLVNDMRSKIDFESNLAMEQITKDTANQTSYLKKNGIRTTKDGEPIADPTTYTAMSQFGTGGYEGTEAYTYPAKTEAGQAPVFSITSGTPMHVLVPDSRGGVQTYYINVPGSFSMSPTKEYNADNDIMGSGRYVEGTINFADERLVADPKMITEKQDGKVKGFIPTGSVDVSKEPTTITARDIRSNNAVELFGEYQVILPFDRVKNQVDLAFPYLQAAHADMQMPLKSVGLPIGEQTGGTKSATPDTTPRKPYDSYNRIGKKNLRKSPTAEVLVLPGGVDSPADVRQFAIDNLAVGQKIMTYEGIKTWKGVN